MNSRQQLLAYLDEIQEYIDKFKVIQVASKHRYQKLLTSFASSQSASALMEHHLIHTERQRATIAKLEELHRKIRELLTSLE